MTIRLILKLLLISLLFEFYSCTFTKDDTEIKRAVDSLKFVLSKLEAEKMICLQNSKLKNIYEEIDLSISLIELNLNSKLGYESKDEPAMVMIVRENKVADIKKLLKENSIILQDIDFDYNNDFSETEHFSKRNSAGSMIIYLINLKRNLIEKEC